MNADIKQELAALRARIDELEAQAKTEATDSWPKIGDTYFFVLAICDALKIGAEARTETVIIESIGNALRRSRCLDAVERDLFTSQIEDEESGELIDDCPLNWGDEPDEYVASVKELLRLSAPKPSELLTTTNPAQISSSPAEAPADVARDAERLDWLLRNLPGDALRYCVGVLSDTSDGKEFRKAIDAAMSEKGGA